jgi:hypothetical protein
MRNRGVDQLLPATPTTSSPASYVVGTGWSPVARCYDASTTFVNKAVVDYASAPQILIDASSGRATAMWIQRGSLYAASAAGYTAPVTPSDCVFNWAEATYPAHFPANGVASQKRARLLLPLLPRSKRLLWPPPAATTMSTTLGH